MKKNVLRLNLYCGLFSLHPNLLGFTCLLTEFLEINGKMGVPLKEQLVMHMGPSLPPRI